MKTPTIIVLDKYPELAQEINTALRNSGISIRVLFTESAYDLEPHLEESQPIAAIIGEPQDGTLEDTIAAVSKLPGYLPVIVRQLEPNAKSISAAMEAGAHSFIDALSDRQLILVVRRELANHQARFEARRMQKKLEEIEHRYNLLLDSARDAIAYIHEGLHIYANRAYLEAMQIEDFSALAGASILELMHTEGSDFKTLLKQIARGDMPDEELEATVKRPDGSEFPASLEFSPARYNGEQCTQLLVRELKQDAELSAEIERLRTLDPLTQLTNRTTFTRRLNALMDNPVERGGVSSVLYLEPDNFSELQNELGVTSSDAFIIDLANVIRGCLSEQDLAARFSDHGFSILVHRNDKDAVADVAACIVDCYSSHIVEAGEHSLTATCSIGINHIGQHTVSAENVIVRARSAWREAAKDGNRAQVYRPKTVSSAETDSDNMWLERLRHALNNQDFSIAKQAIANLDGSEETYVECSIQMHESDGDIGASEYMPFAEKLNLSSAIDRQMLPELLQLVGDSEEQADKYFFYLSQASLQDFSFAAWMQHLLAELDVPGEKLVLMISAEAAKNSLKPVQRLISEMKENGCEFCVTEFDQDQRTFRLLELLDIQYIRLDTQVSGQLEDDNSISALSALAHQAEQQGVQVVASNVTDASQLAALWQCGVKLVQGDFLSNQNQLTG